MAVILNSLGGVGTTSIVAKHLPLVTYSSGPETAVLRSESTFVPFAEWSEGYAFLTEGQLPCRISVVPPPSNPTYNWNFHSFPEEQASLTVVDGELTLPLGGARQIGSNDGYTATWFSVTFDGMTFRTYPKPTPWYRSGYSIYGTSSVPGTLTHELRSSIANLFIGVTSTATNRPEWSTNNFNPFDLVAARNTNNPLYGVVDTSWITAAVQGRPTASFPGMLISPRHVMFSHHVYPGNNRRLAFVSNAGQVFTATTVRSQGFDLIGDAIVAYLDQPIPADIPPVRFLPADVSKYTSIFREFQSYRIGDITPEACMIMRQAMSGLGARFGVHVFNAGTAKQATLYNSCIFYPDYTFIGTGYSSDDNTTTLGAYGNSFSGGWFRQSVGGDSGSPGFMVVGGNPVLVSSQWSAESGSNYIGKGPIINPVMNAIKDPGDSTVYAVNEVDLSAYPVLYP